MQVTRVHLRICALSPPLAASRSSRARVSTYVWRWRATEGDTGSHCHCALRAQECISCMHAAADALAQALGFRVWIEFRVWAARRNRTWGTPTVLSSCSASTSRSHAAGSFCFMRRRRSWSEKKYNEIPGDPAGCGPRCGFPTQSYRGYVGAMAELACRHQGLRGLCSSALRPLAPAVCKRAAR